MKPRRNALNGTQDSRWAAGDEARYGGLIRKDVAETRQAYVLVNNRSEGNAPLTVQALTESLSKELRPGTFRRRAFHQIPSWSHYMHTEVGAPA